MNFLISGASSGIGRAAAVDISLKGHTVWAGVRSPKVFEELQRSKLQNIRPVYLDVCDQKSVDEALSTIQKESGTLHGLVNNAGIAFAGPVEALRLEDWHTQFETNFFGLIRLTKACLPLLRETKGRVVNISSISGRVASPFFGPYASSKFAVEAFSDSLRREMAPLGVFVSVIEPGPIATPIWEKSLAAGQTRLGELDQEVLPVYEARLTRVLERASKMGREAEPVSLVTRAIEDALLSRKPLARYPVGKGIATLSRVSRWMPDRLLDFVIAKGT